MSDVPLLAPEAAAGRVAPLLRAVAGTLAAVLVCVAITALILAALPSSGDEPLSFGESLRIIGRTMWNSVLRPRSPAMETGYRNWILTLQSATPILLTGLAITAAFRANALNIGTQGQYVLGAIAATAIGVHVHGPAMLVIPLHLLAAMAAGALFAAIAAVLERWRNVPVVLSTLLLNFVAAEFLRYLLDGPMRAVSEDGHLLDPQSRELLLPARLPEFFATAPGQGLSLGILIAMAAAIVLSFILNQTTFGFRLRVLGQNPIAARFAGMNTARLSLATLALSGALAGLAGSVRVAGVAPYQLYPDVGMDGIGFTGIAVALLGRLSPVGVVFSALFFGLLSTAFKALERSPLEVHSVAAQGVQGALVIAVLTVTSPQWGRRLCGIRK
jgi:simple sugar transport system permease protein